jgi:hypothetical protein
MAFLHSQDRQEPSVLLPKALTDKLPNIPQASTSVKTPMTEDAHAQELQDKAKKKKKGNSRPDHKRRAISKLNNGNQKLLQNILELQSSF